MVLHLAAATSFLHSFLVSFLLLCKCENQTLVNQNLVNNFTSTLSSIFFFLNYCDIKVRSIDEVVTQQQQTAAQRLLFRYKSHFTFLRFFCSAK